MKNTITILQLYPQDMNIYGDWGNVLTLKRRLEWRGFDATILTYNVGDALPKSFDIVVAGGGQDSGQVRIHQDLLNIGPKLKEYADGGMPILVICGMYQLFGNFFETIDGKKLLGIGIFDAETYGKSERLIGNIITKSDIFGKIIGYENHSGQTYLYGDTQPLAKVIRGAGNNMQDGHEGAVYKNVIGSYLHGSLLPKNPALADYLIAKAVERKYDTSIEPLDDTLTEHARRSAAKRPR